MRKLDAWVLRQNEESQSEGMVLFPPCEIRLIGQMALLESDIALELALTSDVDVFANYQHGVQQRFSELLEKRGFVLDPVAHEAWMPQETRFEKVYDGKLVKGFVAGTDYVLLSKAHKAPLKNSALLTEYLANGASSEFLKLARKYKVDLEQFV